MFKHRLANVALLLGLFFLFGLILGIIIPRWAGLNPAPKIYNTTTFLKQVQTLSQLVTVKYVLEKIEILADPPQNTFRAFLPDDTHVTIIAHGIVNAGVDLSQLQPGDIRVSGKKLYITLPRARIMQAYLDDNKTQVIERNTGFLRAFNKDLEQSARRNAIDDIQRAARSNGILKDAEERARAQLTLLSKQLGFEEVIFTKP
jgi:hypothetical protein